MVRPEKSIVKRFASLKAHLERENPVLVEVIGGFRKLDSIGYRTGLIDTDESYAMQISWWPLVSILGVFSAGKSSFINAYLQRTLQKTGNQAVDDKFTVMCFGEENAGKVLPGLALDADPRFPFYRISDEIENVAEGEGRRIDAYLQLKVTDSEVMRGKILIDSPGFDADAQRTSTLKLTDHIMDISDLVLVFFDARHPEPGSMQDTLEHLVSNTIHRKDSNKFLYILNQIDSAAREDNTEEIVGAWQRALSQNGLTAGRFYTIFNKEVAPPIENAALRARFESKRDADLADIEERIKQVEVERAYRIVGALEKDAYAIRDEAMPAISRLKALWAKRVWRFDAIVLGALALAVFGGAVATGAIGELFALLASMIASPLAMAPVWIGLVVLVLVVHFGLRKVVASYMARKIRQSPEEAGFTKAFHNNTRWYRTLFSRTPVGWGSSARNDAEAVIEQASDFVQNLNDQFTNPSGAPRAPDKTSLPGAPGVTG